MAVVTREVCVRRTGSEHESDVLIADIIASSPPLTTTPGVMYSYDRYGDRKCSRADAALCENGQRLMAQLDACASELGVKSVRLMARTIRINGWPDFRRHDTWCRVSGSLNS